MNRTFKPRPQKTPRLDWPGGVVPEWAKAPQAAKRRAKGPGGKAGAASKRERLQKVMAQSGYGSRRNIEILIAQGHLTINGQVAKLGDSAGPGDKVKLDGKLIRLRYGEQLPRVLMYHKPTGEIVSRDDPEGRPTVFDKLPKVNNGRWVSVGRLDFNTEGLLLFTTSGELANRMTHPRFEVEREYAVRVMGEVTAEMSEKLLKTGVDIDGENCTFDSIEDRGGEGSNHWYHVVLREGKNREVRRMMEAVGLMVSRLMRVRFGNVELPGHVKRGMVREMEEEQVQELLAFAGMNESEPGEEGEEEVEDEFDNIGNRIDPRHAAAPEEDEIDEDIGNRVFPSQARAEEHEPDGNRGTYVPGGGDGEKAPRPGKGGGARRPHGQKPFGFKKHRGNDDNRGNLAPAHQGQAHGQGQGQGHGQGKGKGRHHGQGHGAQGGPPQGQGQPQGQGKGHGQGFRHGKRRKPGNAQGQPHGQGGAQAAQGGGGHGQGGAQGAQPQGGQGNAPAAGQPGQAKPGRNRRNKNRNRNRGAGGAGAPQPASNGGSEI
jgi:23S rRNA pseudouridine2605 synthase